MAVKRNAVLYQDTYPVAASVVHTSFYVDDGLTGADTIQEASCLQRELQELFARGEFLLHKWWSNELAALDHLPPELQEDCGYQELPVANEFSKVLELEWSPAGLVSTDSRQPANHDDPHQESTVFRYSSD